MQQCIYSLLFLLNQSIKSADSHERHNLIGWCSSLFVMIIQQPYTPTYNIRLKYMARIKNKKKKITVNDSNYRVSELHESLRSTRFLVE